MKEVRLPNGRWLYDSDRPLGPPGGFGEVFAGSNEEGDPVAVKRLHLGAEAAAHRELRIASELTGKELQHVMPVLDAGQDAESDRYYVVMPIARESLRESVIEEGPLDEARAVEILSQIAQGLDEVSDLVHRDLKPANVLHFEDRWCIADFGIARFVEESTSTRTLKECLTPHFAAPEQWQLKRATSATDVYALGCIAYVLLDGSPPFDGSTVELREQHLHAAPRELEGCSPRIRTLLSMMLRKTPGSRPSLGRVMHLLSQLANSSVGTEGRSGLGRLASAAAAHEKQRAEEEAAREKAATGRAEREALAREAQGILLEVFSALAEGIATVVPSASVKTEGDSRVIRVGPGTLELDLSMCGRALTVSEFERSEWDVVCGAAIEVRQASPEHMRSASLWYTRRDNEEADYRWYEVGYEGNPLSRERFRFEPAAVTPELADRAHWTAMDVIQTSYRPTPIDDEDLESFCDRWTYILAEACEGRLQNLSKSLPEP